MEPGQGPTSRKSKHWPGSFGTRFKRGKRAPAGGHGARVGLRRGLRQKGQVARPLGLQGRRAEAQRKNPLRQQQATQQQIPPVTPTSRRRPPSSGKHPKRKLFGQKGAARLDARSGARTETMHSSCLTALGSGTTRDPCGPGVLLTLMLKSSFREAMAHLRNNRAETQPPANMDASSSL